MIFSLVRQALIAIATAIVIRQIHWTSALTIPVGYPRTILYIGDSQCYFLGVGGYYQKLADSLAELLQTQVHIDFDCQSYRRFGPCYGQEPPDCEGVGTATKMAQEWCTRQPNPTNYTDVIMMIGVNNLKNIIWKARPADNQYLGNLTGPESIIRDLGRAGDAMRLCSEADIYFAGPLNVQDCGEGPMYNSCEDDITGGPGGKYWRSNWLQQQIANKAEEIGQVAAYINTSGIEHPELFKDIFHTQHPKDVEAVVNAMVQAFSSRFAPPLVHTMNGFKGTVGVINYDDDCEKDWEKRGHNWCGIKREIVKSRTDRESQQNQVVSPDKKDNDSAYKTKIVGVVVSAVGIFIMLLLWAFYDASKKFSRMEAESEHSWLVESKQTMSS